MFQLSDLDKFLYLAQLAYKLSKYNTYLFDLFLDLEILLILLNYDNSPYPTKYKSYQFLTNVFIIFTYILILYIDLKMKYELFIMYFIN